MDMNMNYDSATMKKANIPTSATEAASRDLSQYLGAACRKVPEHGGMRFLNGNCVECGNDRSRAHRDKLRALREAARAVSTS